MLCTHIKSIQFTKLTFGTNLYFVYRDQMGLNTLTKAVLQYPYNAECINLLYAAGDDASLVLKEYSSHHSPYITVILDDHKTLSSLKELSRKVIRSHLMSLPQHRHSNLFVIVPQLPLPRMLHRFLLFNMKLKDDKVT